MAALLGFCYGLDFKVPRPKEKFFSDFVDKQEQIKYRFLLLLLK